MRAAPAAHRRDRLCWPASPRSRAWPAALGRRLRLPSCCTASGRLGQSARSSASCPTRCGASPRSSGPAALPIAHWWPSELPVERPARRSRWRRAVQQRERTSRPRWRRRSVSVPASPRQRSRCSCAPGATCRRSCGRSLGDSTSGAASMPRSAPSRPRRGCRRASCRSCPWSGLALAALLDAGAVRLLLTTAPGLAIVAVGAVLDLVGLLAIRAIARGIG